jgi:hypothetical protein
MIEWSREAIFKDSRLKLFSLALALLIWFTVDMAMNKEAGSVKPLPALPGEECSFSSVPVLVTLAAEDSRNFRVQPREAKVTVRGDARTIKKLQARDIRLVVDLTGIAAAHDMTKRIEASAPAGVTRIKVEPEEVQVNFPPRN